MSDPNRLQAARAAGDPRRLLAAIPYAAFLGLDLGFDLELDPELDPASKPGSARPLRGILRYDPAQIGDPGRPALHGGVIGALLETTAILQVAWSIPELRAPPQTITLTIAYLRSGRPADTFAAARITRRGRRVASVEVLAWQGDRQRPIASASGQLLLGGSSPA